MQQIMFHYTEPDGVISKVFINWKPTPAGVKLISAEVWASDGAYACTIQAGEMDVEFRSWCKICAEFENQERIRYRRFWSNVGGDQAWLKPPRGSKP